VKQKRVVVAMSGGVDSSVAAALLVERGYDVTGMMLRLWGEPDDGGANQARAANRCCTLDAVDDARRVARILGIPFYPLNAVRKFKERVVDHFVAEYARGHTPNPCLACNREIKFGYLLDMALGLDADYLATGHYARIRRTDDVRSSAERHQLLRAVDRGKDQSYVLYMLGQEQLRHVLLPLGEYTKPQVRDMAARWNLPVAGKRDSQDLCFVRDQDYRRFLRTYAPETVRPGPIVDLAGREIGRHQGLPYYTIGQRRGLGVAWTEPLYVIAIDVAHNALIVGTASQLGRRQLRVKDVQFVSGCPPSQPTPVTVKIRYTGQEAAATLHPGDKMRTSVRLSRPLRDVTPGQAAVFYQGEILLGGGIIAEEEET
jgi:tRNA-specific 2-thiouridylase